MYEMYEFHEECKKNDIETVRFLLENGANVNLQNNSGYTPLCCASSNGHIEVVSLLLENGAKVTTVTLDNPYLYGHILDSAQKFNDL